MNQVVRQYQILVIGEPKVGKTQLINQALGIQFQNNYTPTQYNQYNTSQLTLSIQQSTQKVIFKEASLQTLKLINQTYFPLIDYILFIFDITNQQSFNKVNQYIEWIIPKLKYTNPMVLMIGSKADLYQKRAVNYEKLSQFNASLELSALDGVNVQETFKSIRNYAELLNNFIYKANLLLSKLYELPQKNYEIQYYSQFKVAIPTQIKKLKKNLNDNDQIQQVINIMLLGQTHVGKSSIMSRFFQQQLVNQSQSSWMCLNTRKLSIILKQQYKLKIYDPPGADKFKKVIQQQIKKMQILLLIFDVTNRQSFQNIKLIYKDYTLLVDIQNVTFVTIGNKIDFTNMRTVSFEQGQKLAQELNSTYFQVSAKNNEGVLQAFLIILQQYILNKLK